MRRLSSIPQAHQMAGHESPAGTAAVRYGAPTAIRKAGVVRLIPYGSNPETCPIRALQAWLEAAGINEGPVFRGVTGHGKVQGRLSG